MLSLLDKFEGPKERVGFILKDDTIVEVDNICGDPENGFEVRAEDLIRYEDEMAATWHTHPGKNANPSMADIPGFTNWPHLLHYIVGTDGVRCFAVKGGKVVPHG
jgi:proteasome lid subunit RPN8/RPN11